MFFQMKGEFLSKRQGKSDDGKEYSYSNVLSGDDVLRIYGYDPGAAVSRLSPVSVYVEQRQDKKTGKLYHSIAKA